MDGELVGCLSLSTVGQILLSDRAQARAMVTFMRTKSMTTLQRALLSSQKRVRRVGKPSSDWM